MTRIQADATSHADLARHTRGAVALYNCANPSAYQHWQRDWPPLAASMLAAAEQTEAVLTVTSNLYAYGPVDRPISADLPLAATDHKGRLRASMWNDAHAAHEAGRIRMTEVRASDFIGALDPAAGLILMYADQAMRGRQVFAFGDPDVRHSFTYVPDVARTLAAVAMDERAWGKAWHVPSAPARTVREAIADIALAADAQPPKIRKIPRPLLRLTFPFVPLLREVGDMLYQWDRPFVLDDAPTRDTFGIRPTRWDDVIHATAMALRVQHDAPLTPAA